MTPTQWAIETTIGRVAGVLDAHAPGWWAKGRGVHPADLGVAVLAASRPLTLFERVVCGKEQVDEHLAGLIVRAWSREVERRRTHGTPVAVVGPEDIAEAEAKPGAHVRVQHDLDGGDEQAVWFLCEHCGTRRYTRATAAQDLRRDAHDFHLRHRKCPAPRPVVQ